MNTQKKQQKLNEKLKQKQIKPKSIPTVHYQTTYMQRCYMTYCGRRNISTSVKTTFNKNEVTCLSCRKLLNLD